MMALRSMALGVVACAVLTGGAAYGQASAASGADPSSAMAVTYQQELDALGTMSGSMGPMVVAAQARIKLMKEFISDQKLEGDWANFTPDPKASTFQSLTFNQALQTAFDHQKNMAPTTPVSTDLTTMASEVQATQTLIHKQWNELNGYHQQVAAMTAFLTSEKKLKDYKAWAMEEADKQAQSASAARAAQEKAAEAHYQHQQQLRMKWDEQQHQQMMETVAAVNQAAALSTGSGSGGGGSTSGAAPASQSSSQGDVAGASPPDYYGGSYWNGYADPYYDVYGGAAAGAAVGAAAADDRRDAWDRAAVGAGERGRVAPRR